MTTITQGTRPAQGKVIFFLVLTTVFWGGSFLFTKLGVAEVSPPYFVLLRFGLASLLLGLICLPRLKRLNRLILQRGALVGLALGTTNLTFVLGVQGTSISRAGVLNNLFVLFIPLITKVVWKERIGAANAVGILFASCGIGLLAGGGGSGFSRGDLISTLCACFIALQIIAVSKILKDDDVWLVSLVQFCVVSCLAGFMACFVAPPAGQLSVKAIVAIVYCAIFPTIICFTLQNYYQRYVTPTQAGLIYTLDPVWSLLAGFMVLGERLTIREWYGCGLIFAAVLLPLVVRFGYEQRLKLRYARGA